MKQALHLILFSIIVSTPVTAQFFGRNKPKYRDFDFKVMQTDHYDLYYYMKNKKVIERLGQWSEMWYDHHARVFKDTIDFKNPILLFNNHADFQQNNAISGAISPGTGGVTEAFKNRVVMPLTFTHQQTNHVLGHELVHAFQFDNVIRGDSTNLSNLRFLPLWMSEGLAEYLSLGSEDSQTAMWMRDAVATNDIPDLKQLNSFQYFPYRYGHAMWAFLSGYYGDDAIEPIYHVTAVGGLNLTLDSLLQTNAETLSGMWANAMKTYYNPLIEGRDDFPKGKKMKTPENDGRINVSPIISPNGKYFIYVSNQDLISTDLFMADARNGEDIRKVASLSKGGADHIDYLESAGSWSPNSKEFVYVVFKGGKNALVIVDVETGKTQDPIFIEKAPALTHPSWSVDGKTIVFTGKKEGQVDLFSYNLKTGKTEQLTNDIYSEIAPKHSPDGTKLVFSYDKRSFLGETYDGMYTLDLAEMNLADQTISILPVFQGADNVSATYDYEGNILFVSDADGFRDLFKYNAVTKELVKLSNLKVGFSGITRYSPCISASRKSDRIMACSYGNKSYTIMRLMQSKLLEEKVDGSVVDKYGAILPFRNPEKGHYVDAQLNDQGVYAFDSEEGFADVDYKPRFRLDYIGGGAGVGVNNNTFTSNTSLQGGIQALFTDILGNHQLFTNVSLNGEWLDFGSQLAYLNRSKRLAYGLSVGHVPLRTGFQSFENDVLTDQDGNSIDVIRRDINILRLFNESLSAFAHYPFSTTLRLEGGVTGFYQHFRQDLTQEYYFVDDFNNLLLIQQDRMKVETPDEIRFNQYYTLTRGWGAGANVALVGDNSFFGLTGPVSGHRFRIGLENQMGIDNYFATLVDLRKYQYFKPFTLALRAMNYNRFEQETNTVYPFYVGNIGFVRGYDDYYDDALINPVINFDRMVGSKIGLVSAELRLPFFGPKELALINSSFLFSDLILFFDSGVSFDSFDHLQNGRPTNVIATDDNGNIIYDGNGFPIYEVQTTKPLLATSAGIGMRFNIGNIIIIEPYYARQLVDNGRWNFGLNFIPGW